MSNENDESSDKGVELPHHAHLDAVSGLITFVIDRIALSLTIDEFLSLAEELDDIAQVLSQITVTESQECPTCGATIEMTYIEPPEDSDFH